MPSEITIAVIFHNEKEALPQILNSLKSAEDSERCALLLIDNASTDGSSLVAQSMVSTDFAEWKFFERKHNHLGEARAQAISLARTEWVIFVDADCSVEKDWISTYLRMLPHLPDKVAALGSGNDVKTDTWVQRAVRSMMATPLGTFGAGQVRDLEAPNVMARPTRHVPTCNAAYRKQAVVEAGNFSSEFAHFGEDIELNLRLQKKGWRLVHLPRNGVTHGFTVGVRCWAAKMFRYGRGQWKILTHHPEHLSLRMLTALCFLPAITFLLSELPLSTVVVYACALTAASLYSVRKSPTESENFAATALLFSVTHVFYSLGSIVGFFEWLALPFRKAQDQSSSLRSST